MRKLKDNAVNSTFSSSRHSSKIGRQRRLALFGAGVVFAQMLSGAFPVALAAEPEFVIETVAEGLVDPWAIAALPDGDILVTEKAGRLRLIRDGILQTEPVDGVPRVRVGGQGGLMDLVPAPDFAESRQIYMTIAKSNADDSLGTTALVRARFDGARLVDVEEVLETSAWAEARSHYGTRLAFDAAGHVFLTIADRSAFYMTGRDLSEHPAQRLDNHMGKILRVNLDGSVPADNPFVGRDGALPEIWTLGHRDPQAIAFRPETGAMWSAEHGPLGGDELNLLEPGSNYGWPVVSKGGNYTDVTGFASVPSRPDMREPVYFWPMSIAPSNIVFYDGEAFPQWRGDALISGLVGLRLTRVSFDGDRVSEVSTVVDGLGRIRDVHVGPGGLVYLAITAGEGVEMPILRLRPAD
ncbi:MAG: PQQ-dependent sugar dehydrogenase [Gammaproteobacteria bacterium]|jgi:glucose/arabinose dehydrogenase